MFNRFKIGTKIVGGVIFIILLSQCIGFYALLNLSNLGGNLQQISSVELPAVNNLKSIDKEMNFIVSCERGLNLESIFREKAVRDNLFKSVTESWSRLDEYWARYEKLSKRDDEKKLWDEFTVRFNAWKAKHDVVMTALRNKQKLAEAGVAEKDPDFQKWGREASRAELDSRESLQASSGDLDKLVSVIAVQAVTSAENTRRSATRATGVFMTMMIIGGIFAVLFGVYLSKSITTPLKKGLVMIEEMGRGHLSMRLKMSGRRDEVGLLSDAMDQFAENLQKYIVNGMQKIAGGNVNVETPVMDDKDEIGPALRGMVETINGLIREIDMLMKSAREGRLTVRGNAEAFNGAYREIVQGVNYTLDALSAPVVDALAVLENVAQKDMTARIDKDYRGDYARIKEALNLAVENLDKALQQVAIGAQQVASASVQVSTGGQSLSQGASEQASSLQEVSSSLQEMSSMTRQNAINAKEAKNIAEHARGTADKGVESMERMSSAIDRIKTSSDATAKIVKTIDEIAFQTNLLALNAAVEAARAGDAGKGFAVVAEEVRNLAMRSAEAAKNTAALIEDAVKNSENGVSINVEVLKNFREITEGIGKVGQVVAEIAAASDQQDQGISQVNKAVEQLNLLTQQNAANAEESASAAEEMSSQSEEMRSMVAGFHLTASADFTAAPQIAHSEHLPHHPVAGKKGGMAASGLHPDPRKVIPLDDRDRNILDKF